MLFCMFFLVVFAALVVFLGLLLFLCIVVFPSLVLCFNIIYLSKKKKIEQKKKKQDILPCFNVAALGPLGVTDFSPRNVGESMQYIVLFFCLPNNFGVIGNLIFIPFIFGWLSIFFQIYIVNLTCSKSYYLDACQ
jgi:hypothetical protein